MSVFRPEPQLAATAARDELLTEGPLSHRPLTSIREADWRHQADAMAKGYNSMAEYAIDELLAQILELRDRMDRFEQQINDLRSPT